MKTGWSRSASAQSSSSSQAAKGAGRDGDLVPRRAELRTARLRSRPQRTPRYQRNVSLASASHESRCVALARVGVRDVPAGHGVSTAWGLSRRPRPPRTSRPSSSRRSSGSAFRRRADGTSDRPAAARDRRRPTSPRWSSARSFVASIQESDLSHQRRDDSLLACVKTRPSGRSASTQTVPGGRSVVADLQQVLVRIEEVYGMPHSACT